MTDLISREAAIALLKSEFYEQCPKGSVQRLLFANAIDALTNMPSAETGPVVRRYVIGTDGKLHSWDRESWVPVP